MRRSMGDRRQRPRFDVVGQLAGTLDAAVSMALRDVGRGGAQVESFVKLAAGSLHRATFNGDGIEAAVQVCVRHVKPVVSSSGEQRYLIGDGVHEPVAGSARVDRTMDDAPRTMERLWQEKRIERHRRARPTANSPGSPTLAEGDAAAGRGVRPAAAHAGCGCSTSARPARSSSRSFRSRSARAGTCALPWLARRSPRRCRFGGGQVRRRAISISARCSRRWTTRAGGVWKSSYGRRLPRLAFAWVSAESDRGRVGSIDDESRTRYAHET